MIDTAVSPSPPRSKGSRIRIALTAALGLVVLAALGVGAWRGYDWAHADKATADQRDSALDGARQAAINLNSVNPDNVPNSVTTMESSATGDMLDQIDKNKDQLVQLAGQSKARLDAGVLSAALTELNTDERTAKALVVLTQTTTYPNQQPSKQRLTWTLDMRDVDGVWKAAQATTMGQPVLLEGPELGQNGTPAPGQNAAPSQTENPAPPANQGGS